MKVAKLLLSTTVVASDASLFFSKQGHFFSTREPVLYVVMKSRIKMGSSYGTVCNADPTGIPSTKTKCICGATARMQSFNIHILRHDGYINQHFLCGTHPLLFLDTEHLGCSHTEYTIHRRFRTHAIHPYPIHDTHVFLIGK